MDCLVAVKAKLLSGNATCVLSDGFRFFSSREGGIRPLIDFIDSGKSFRGYSAADKIVGKAAALLYAYMGITALYAQVIGRQALEVCKNYGIAVEYGIITDKIKNRAGDDICPMEKTVSDVSEPFQAYQKIKEKLKTLSDNQSRK